MEPGTNFKFARNLSLLLGNEHPPEQLEKPMITPQQMAAGVHPVRIDARNTANFRSSSYCGIQGTDSSVVRRQIIQYYQEMLRRVPLWRHQMDGHSKKEDVRSTKQETSAVKPEPQDEDEEAAQHPGAAGSSMLYRAVGILTQVQDPSNDANAQTLPWEFHVIRDIDDVECFTPVLSSMKRRPTPFFLLRESEAAAGGDSKVKYGTVDGGLNVGAEGADVAEEEAAVQDGSRLSLFTRLTKSFTGVYEGMAVGVVGEVFQRSARGVLTALLVHDFVLPERPRLPWRVNRPFTPPLAPRDGVRIHFCSGPFPRRDVARLLRSAASQALHRGADILVIGGPLVKPFEGDFERSLLPTLGSTFAETLDTYVDALEETLGAFYANRPLVPHMKVVLVSHRDDVTQIPILPTTMYGISDTEDIMVRSNPCRISVNGIHISICNEDVAGTMRDRMVERWPVLEGSLRRGVETLVQSRLYTPIYEIPSAVMDMKYLRQLRMDYVPGHNELLGIEGGSSKEERNEEIDEEAHGLQTGWGDVLSLGDPLIKPEAKRVKLEEGGHAGHSAAPFAPGDEGAVEYMPHIMFLPSTRPQFAVVTHQCEEVDGTDVDNIASASGVLVVNPMVWSRRSKSGFTLTGAEVTIPDVAKVLTSGATAANGVACGILTIFKDESGPPPTL